MWHVERAFAEARQYSRFEAYGAYRWDFTTSETPKEDRPVELPIIPDIPDRVFGSLLQASTSKTREKQEN